MLIPVYLGIAVASIVALIASSVFYAVAPAASADGPQGADRPRPWQLCLELLRSALVASLVGGILVAADWGGARQGLLLGLSLIVLPVVLLSGSVLWERVPVRTATVHALDWVIKLAAIGAIIGAFS